VTLRGERAQDMRLVEMVRRRDDDRVQIIELEEVLDVGEHVGDAEAVGERPAFGRSLSQIAASSAPRILARTGKCANCAIAPAPTTPIRIASVIVAGSVCLIHHPAVA
jgi:hypothetical protein